MFTKPFRTGAVSIGVMFLVFSAPASAQNLLVNPGFEESTPGAGTSGWFTFGNVYTEATNAPQFVPFEGDRLVSMFGNFNAPYNASGIFQEFTAAPGTEWELSSKARHFSGDALAGSQEGGGNWVVQKIVFKDAQDDELPGAVESTVLDGTYATDEWHEAAPIRATAPAGTVQVEAFILYIQPGTAGGAAHIDNVDFRVAGSVPVTPSTWGTIKGLYRD